jgi:CRISPR-associated protein Cmr2
MIAHAQTLLKKEAKGKANRNACALELRKRHGGSRIFTRKWADKGWPAFDNAMRMTGDSDRELSHSLLYRLEKLRPGIEAIMKSDTNAEENLITFITRQIERSGIKSKVPEKEIAEWICQIVWDRGNNEDPFSPEGLLIAGFLRGEVKNDELV